MLNLKTSRTLKTFDQVLLSYKPATRRGFQRMFSNFTKFCESNYQGNMEEMVRELKKASEPTVYTTIQEWINFNGEKAPTTIKVWFSYLKKYLTHRGIDLSKTKDNLSFKRTIEEERYPLSLENVQKIMEVAGVGMRLKLLTQLSSGMRRGEMLQLKKKDFHIGKRIMIKIPALIAKFSKARTTFVSSEVTGQLTSKLNKLKDDDYVFGSSGVSQQNLGDSYEQNLTRYLEKIGLDMRYESTGHHQITSHSFRAYFITKISRHDENIAKKLSGQKGYLLQYDRLTDEEKLEKYIEFEPDLYIFKQKPKSEEILELQKEVEKDQEALKILSQLYMLEATELIEPSKEEDEKEIRLTEELRNKLKKLVKPDENILGLWEYEDALA